MGSHKVICIRCDANDNIASGHMMRCLTIAEELKEQGADVRFLLSDEESKKNFAALTALLSLENTFPVHILSSDYKQPELELSTLFSLLSSCHCELLLIDSYFVTPHYLLACKKQCITAYIDDMMAFSYPVDIVINYDLQPDKQFYQNIPTVLLGGSYTPLRRQFRHISYALQKTPKHVLLSSGATDPYDVIPTLLQKIFKKEQILSALTYHVILNSSASCQQTFSSLTKQFSNICLHEKVSDMAGLMQQCDFAISAGGTTLYELCAVSVPAICYSMADNQITPAKDFTSASCCLYAGDCRNNPDFYNCLIEQMNSLCLDFSIREQLHQHMKQLNPGNGAVLIANELIRSQSETCL